VNLLLLIETGHVPEEYVQHQARFTFPSSNPQKYRRKFLELQIQFPASSVTKSFSNLQMSILTVLKIYFLLLGGRTLLL